MKSIPDTTKHKCQMLELDVSSPLNVRFSTFRCRIGCQTNERRSEADRRRTLRKWLFQIGAILVPLSIVVSLVCPNDGIKTPFLTWYPRQIAAIPLVLVAAGYSWIQLNKTVEWMSWNDWYADELEMLWGDVLAKGKGRPTESLYAYAVNRYNKIMAQLGAAADKIDRSMIRSLVAALMHTDKS